MSWRSFYLLQYVNGWELSTMAADMSDTSLFSLSGFDSYYDCDISYNSSIYDSSMLNNKTFSVDDDVYECGCYPKGSVTIQNVSVSNYSSSIYDYGTFYVEAADA